MAVESEKEGLQINSKKLQSETLVEEGKPSYPYMSLSFIMAATTLQSSFTGAQAVLELFFSRFVFVCSGARSKTLGTVAVNIFIALNQLTALSGGFLADWVIGNFHTQNISNVVATLGIVLALFGSWQYTLHQPHCCGPGATNTTTHQPPPSACHELNKHRIFTSLSLNVPPELALVLILVGCVLFSIGYGHTNAIQSVFVGDQFPEGQSAAKEKSFSWYYLFENVGCLAAESGMPFSRQSLGFVITLLITAGAFGLSTVVFALGMCWYVCKKPENQLCKCRKKESEPLLKPQDAKTLQVENRRQLLRICGVYVPLIAFWALFFQQNSTWVLQGAMMNCYIGKLHLPPDMMPSINDLMVVLLIPILDYLVYPHLRKTMNIRVKPLQKIVAGMVCVALSFLFACLLQLYITDPPVSCRGDVSIFWQVPQLLMVSFAEVLVVVTGLEFAYTQSPPESRNLIKALWCITQALGAGLNAAIALIELPLVYEFVMYTALMVVVICVFVGINWNYQYRREKNIK